MPLLPVRLLADAPPPDEGWRRLALISDTHDVVRPALFGMLAGCEAILHAGDLASSRVVAELEAIAPLHAVAGNCDWGETRALGPFRVVEFPFGAVVIAHGHRFPFDRIHEGMLGAYGTTPRLRLLLYGHTHVPAMERTDDGILIVNPGSANEPRIGPDASIALLDYDPAKGLEAELRASFVVVPEGPRR